MKDTILKWLGIDEIRKSCIGAHESLRSHSQRIFTAEESVGLHIDESVPIPNLRKRTDDIYKQISVINESLSGIKQTQNRILKKIEEHHKYVSGWDDASTFLVNSLQEIRDAADRQMEMHGEVSRWAEICKSQVKDFGSRIDSLEEKTEKPKEETARKRRTRK